MYIYLRCFAEKVQFFPFFSQTMCWPSRRPTNPGTCSLKLYLFPQSYVLFVRQVPATKKENKPIIDQIGLFLQQVPSCVRARDLSPGHSLATSPCNTFSLVNTPQHVPSCTETLLGNCCRELSPCVRGPSSLKALHFLIISGQDPMLHSSNYSTVGLACDSSPFNDVLSTTNKAHQNPCTLFLSLSL